MILERGRELLAERLRARREPGNPEFHAGCAIAWLEAAQDATADGGVSHSYLVGERWMRSYPETTGYIVPTLLNWGRRTGDARFFDRALAMADWELATQLEDGAVPDLVSGAPVVFDAGQVLFGFVAAARHSGDPKYREGARKAAAWLVRALAEDGVWRSEHDSGGPGRAYNARSAWALLEYARLAGDDQFAAPMRRFLDWVLEQERSPGWFDRNCLTDDSAPLLHTIAYTARGLLESGLLLSESRYVDASHRTAAALAEAVRSDGFLAGRFADGFRPTVGWACLTGMAQMSIVWRRHCELRPEPGFVGAARTVNRYLMRTQDTGSSNAGLRGGIRGSYPVNGAYGKWRVLNWATKFFVDALLVELDATALEYRG